jgi:hypothetical protein
VGETIRSRRRATSRCNATPIPSDIPVTKQAARARSAPGLFSRTVTKPLVAVSFSPLEPDCSGGPSLPLRVSPLHLCDSEIRFNKAAERLSDGCSRTLARPCAPFDGLARPGSALRAKAWAPRSRFPPPYLSRPTNPCQASSHHFSRGRHSCLLWLLFGYTLSSVYSSSFEESRPWPSRPSIH